MDVEHYGVKFLTVQFLSPLIKKGIEVTSFLIAELLFMRVVCCVIGQPTSIMETNGILCADG